MPFGPSSLLVRMLSCQYTSCSLLLSRFLDMPSRKRSASLPQRDISQDVSRGHKAPRRIVDTSPLPTTNTNYVFCTNILHHVAIFVQMLRTRTSSTPSMILFYAMGNCRTPIAATTWGLVHPSHLQCDHRSFSDPALAQALPS